VTDIVERLRDLTITARGDYPDWHPEECSEAADEIVRLRAALKDMFSLMDEGLLVRDISDDCEPLWAMRQLKFVQRLQQAHAALSSHEVSTNNSGGSDG
jgi:hypothetical protein